MTDKNMNAPQGNGNTYINIGHAENVITDKIETFNNVHNEVSSHLEPSCVR